MTRSELLRAVADIVEVVDVHIREPGEPTDANAELNEVRVALGLHPNSTELTYAAAVRVGNALAAVTKQRDLVQLQLDAQVPELLRAVKENLDRAVAAEKRVDGLNGAIQDYERALRVERKRADARGAPSTTFTFDPTLDTIQGRSALQANVDDNTASIRLAEAERQIGQVIEILNVPHGESLRAVAERRMTSIRDLVSKTDAYDREMSEALGGLFHGDNAVLAVKKLAAHYRATSVLEKKTATPPLVVVSKDAAQEDMSAHLAFCAIGEYEHRKGGRYIVFAHTVDEATLQPLVHYYSIAKKTRWTRTFTSFVELVDGKPRFMRTGDTTGMLLAIARGVEIE